MLDLGCGTGLCGEAFKGVAECMVGVDLSEKMLEQARSKSIYAKLICANILDHLSIEMETYDLVISADVLIYMGQLDAFFNQLKRVMNLGGHVGLTVESCNASTFELKSTQRYGHSTLYINALASSNGFSIVDVQDIKLRKEKGEDITGSAILLQYTGS
jgi:predicted TPR repeat methyltransferase